MAPKQNPSPAPSTAPRALSASLVSLFESSQALAADVLTAANAAEALAYRTAARAMETAARRERARIGYAPVRVAFRRDGAR